MKISQVTLVAAGKSPGVQSPLASYVPDSATTTPLTMRKLT